MAMLAFRNGLLHCCAAVFIAAAIVGAFDNINPTAGVRVPSSYVLGPDDVISIRVLQAPELADKPIRIDWNGYIDLPVAGRVRAAGATVETLRTELEAKFAAIIREPQVTINVEEFRSRPASVIGSRKHSWSTPDPRQEEPGRSTIARRRFAPGRGQHH